MAKKGKDRFTGDPRWELHQATGALDFLLELFGDELGKRHKWKNDLRGIEAVWYYLMQKHHWTPAQLRTMTHADLRFALTEEMHGWTAP
ncbi:hypothetical protein [Pseudoxanthomonas winnipegensis]|uniref:Uncharacterized protein n=1 Tax=Pseudoxanthomonas winnipegensis TaxID=2480810 RepID=A0A4Q8M3D6_9GAMM|nr:hypothetical protein [Pseudoxanthomonas winnipegensis]TAA42497.1 hypothetical protein EA655_10750 [Pseudoxanthomonas winnipegensis]